MPGKSLFSRIGTMLVVGVMLAGATPLANATIFIDFDQTECIDGACFTDGPVTGFISFLDGTDIQTDQVGRVVDLFTTRDAFLATAVAISFEVGDSTPLSGLVSDLGSIFIDQDFASFRDVDGAADIFQSRTPQFTQIQYFSADGDFAVVLGHFTVRPDRQVPEPVTLVLAALGLVGVARSRRRIR